MHIIGNWQISGGGIWIKNNKIGGQYHINGNWHTLTSNIDVTINTKYTF